MLNGLKKLLRVFIFNDTDRNVTVSRPITFADAVTVPNATITYAKIQDVTALSLVGRSADTAGVSAAIAGTDGQVARVAGTALGFGTIVAAGIATDAVTEAKILADAVTTVKILNLNVTTAKINDLAVTVGKLADDAVETVKIKGLNVTTAKVADAAVANSQMKIRALMALADAAATLTAAEIIDKSIFTITPTVARVLTTDTGTAIVGAIPRAQVGTVFVIVIVNTAAFDVTLDPGADVLMGAGRGKHIINNVSGTWMGVVTSGTTVTIYRA